MMAEGSTYSPLLSNGKEYLCPDCGGYGLIYGVLKCNFCDGAGVIALDDKRLKVHPGEKVAV
jgi:DnaJ-class molecular chaperone